MAEGTPTELKRSIGSDMIVTQIEGDPHIASEAMRNIQGVEQVASRGSELTISVSNGAELIGNVAIALNQSGVNVREIMLRTPTLDDVFLQVTGERMQFEDTPEEVAA